MKWEGRWKEAIIAEDDFETLEHNRKRKIKNPIYHTSIAPHAQIYLCIYASISAHF